MGLVALLAASGCVEQRNLPSWTTYDSAGIRIVASVGTAWGEASRWRLTSAPKLVIGGAAGEEPYLFGGIVGAGRLSDGRLFVADADALEVRFFDEMGAFLVSVGGPGEGPGEFSWINQAGVGRGDTVFVFDSRLRRMSLLTSSGGVERMVTLTPSTEGSLDEAAWLPDGRFVARTHTWSDPWNEKGDLTTGTSVYVLFDSSGVEETVLARGPGIEARLLPLSDTYATYELPLFAYRPAAVAGPDLLYYGTSRLREIGIVAYSTGGAGLWRDLRFDPNLTDADVQAAADSAIRRRVPPGVAFTPDDMPSAAERPPYSQMLLDSDGNLWVAEFVERDEDARSWTVFDRSGRVLGDVEVPPGFALLAVQGEEVLGRHRDALGVESLWVLEISR